MRYLLTGLSAASLFISASTDAFADKRVAFVVGNGASNKVEELNAYLTNYPNGTFKAIALARIAALQDGPSNATSNLSGGNIDQAVFSEEATQVTEDQLGLDKGQRRDVQRRLTGLGFDIKATGKFDEATRGVISRWQAARGYPKTGYLNALQHKALQSEILAPASPPTTPLPTTSCAFHRAGASAAAIATVAAARPTSSA